MQRAAMHTNIAQQFLQRLSLLNPNQSSDGNLSNGNFDSIPDADNELAAEYQHVQQLYSQLQAAKPKH
jgi:hypothetical protein